MFNSFKEEGTPVYLSMYSLGGFGKINAVLSKFNTGVYHAGIEVYGKEWSFLGCDEENELDVPPSASQRLLTLDGEMDERGGVRYCDPGQLNEVQFCGKWRGKRKIGVTTMTEEKVHELLDTMDKEGWIGHTYDLLTKNCCHFSEEFAQRLGVPKFTFWVKRWVRFWMRIAAVYQKGVDSRMQEKYANFTEGYKFGDFTRGLLYIGRQRRGVGISDRYRCGDCTCGLFRFCCFPQDKWDRGFVWNRFHTHRVLLMDMPNGGNTASL